MTRRRTRQVSSSSAEGSFARARPQPARHQERTMRKPPDPLTRIVVYKYLRFLVVEREQIADAQICVK